MVPERNQESTRDIVTSLTVPKWYVIEREIVQIYAQTRVDQLLDEDIHPCWNTMLDVVGVQEQHDLRELPIETRRTEVLLQYSTSLWYKWMTYRDQHPQDDSHGSAIVLSILMNPIGPNSFDSVHRKTDEELTNEFGTDIERLGQCRSDPGPPEYQDLLTSEEGSSEEEIILEPSLRRTSIKNVISGSAEVLFLPTSANTEYRIVHLYE